MVSSIFPIIPRPVGAVPLEAKLDNIDLRPCPCCGSAAEFRYAEWSLQPRKERIFIQCTNLKCRLQGIALRRFRRSRKYGPANVTFGVAQKLRELWNERHATKTALKRVNRGRGGNGQCRVTRPSSSLLH